MRTFVKILIICLFVSCNRVSNNGNGERTSTEVNAAKGNEIILDTFIKTKFANRADELIYIRKYIEYKLPKIIIEAEPEKMEDALEVLVGNGKNVTLEEAVKYTWMYQEDYERLWYLVSEKDLSFVFVKDKLSSYKTLHPEEQRKIEEEIRTLPENKNSDKETSLPLEVESLDKELNNRPEYLSNLSVYSPNVSLVCEDQGYSDCLKDVTEIVRELVEIRAKHLSNKNNSAYLEFYSTQKAIVEKRNWKKDAKNIQLYIYQNIEIYESTLKECGYDNEDWFKKLPKDLYKYFELDKTEILNSVSEK